MDSVFAHIDIEADGNSPYANNMISLGVVFTDKTGKIVGEFLGDIQELPNHKADPSCITEFWERDENNRKELQRIRENARPAFDVMKDLNKYIADMNPKRVTWVARPAAYDWQWINYYQNYYLSKGGKGSLINHPKRQAFKSVDASTMRDIFMSQWNLKRDQMEEQCKEWTKDCGFKMTHNPLDDARYQAVIYHKIFDALSENKKI